MIYILLILLIAVNIFCALQLRELAKVLIGYNGTGVEIANEEHEGEDYLNGIEDLSALLNAQKPTEPTEGTDATEPSTANNFFTDLFTKAGVEIITDYDEVSKDQQIKGGYYE